MVGPCEKRTPFQVSTRNGQYTGAKLHEADGLLRGIEGAQSQCLLVDVDQH